MFIRLHSIVRLREYAALPEVGLEGGLVPEPCGAVGLGADEGALARVLPEVVAQVHARLERLRTHRARKVADVLCRCFGSVK